jgi:hypothetical protein
MATLSFSVPFYCRHFSQVGKTVALAKDFRLLVIFAAVVRTLNQLLTSLFCTSMQMYVALFFRSISRLFRWLEKQLPERAFNL